MYISGIRADRQDQKDTNRKKSPGLQDWMTSETKGDRKGTADDVM